MGVRFLMIGGFLGAGKTTTIGRLARTYAAAGRRVAVVTNDQSQGLVDTHLLRGHGFAVEEVPGACFCCRFDDLVGRIAALEDGERPDVILAEPVGSCTDLVATVIQPLKDLYRDRFRVGPYAVLFKPSHGQRILRRQPAGGFSPKAAYIFRKQLEEADAILINRIDELDPEEVSELIRLVEEQFPGTTVLPVSAATGDGFDALLRVLDHDGPYGRKILDIDYDTYAEGEAELGWLNATARLTADQPYDLDPLLLRIVQRLTAACQNVGGEIAHLKLIGMDDSGRFGVANVVSSDSPPRLSLPSGLRLKQAVLIVNARVAVDPNWLETQAHEMLTDECEPLGAKVTLLSAQSLRPGRPIPTYRYESAKS